MLGAVGEYKPNSRATGGKKNMKTIKPVEKLTEKNSPVGKRIVSGAYGAGLCIGATKNFLAVEFDSGVETTVDRSGNLHFERPAKY